MSDSTAEALPEALIILVQQQCCLTEQGVVCRLLATSKSLHSFILAKCTGRVHIFLARMKHHDRRDQLRSSCHAWLAKYGCLMQSLVWESGLSGRYGRVGCAGGFDYCKQMAFGWIRDGEQMAELLKAAAATPQGLQLRSLNAAAWEKLPLVLQQLPAATLTHVGFVMKGEDPDHATWAEWQIDLGEYELDPEANQKLWEEAMAAVPDHDTKATAAALKSFTQLQSLQLINEGEQMPHATHSPVLQVLPQLTSLTKLSTAGLLDGAIDANGPLPPHLQELELIDTRRNWGEPPPLALGHLTALTRLHTSRPRCDVAADDVLPPNLQSLCVGKVVSVKPLLPLTRLRELTVAGLPAVADIAAAVPTAGHVASDDKSKDSERAAAAPAGEATPVAAPAGGSFEDRAAQLQLLLPGVAVKQVDVWNMGGCWCCDSNR